MITTFVARPHDTFQPASGFLIPSDQGANLSLQFESSHLTAHSWTLHSKKHIIVA